MKVQMTVYSKAKNVGELIEEIADLERYFNRKGVPWKADAVGLNLDIAPMISYEWEEETP